MPRINLLDKHVSELIAAGEVIERPASVVKEMLENSIDAKASAITVEYRNGGISYIRISDNGCGIEKDDAHKAFLRHATSKIKLADDLHFISTLGFRGEALASIAAVSKINMLTKTTESPLGTSVKIYGGELVETEDAGCPDGTTIIVTDLFYNVPARHKFLKSDLSEGSAITNIVEKLALSHPEISFKLIGERKQKLLTPGNGDLLSAVAAVFGEDIASKMIRVSYKLDKVSVNGCISIPESSRATRAMQHFFVNERYIKSGVCFAGVEEGYKNSVMTGKYPMCVLDIRLPLENVDVNVHPSKTEVKFADERAVFNAIYFAIKTELSKNDKLKNIHIDNKSVSNITSTFKDEDTEQIVLASENKINEENKKINQLNDIPRKTETPTSFLHNTSSNESINLSSHEAEYSVLDKQDGENKSEEAFSFINPDSFSKKEDSKENDIPKAEIVANSEKEDILSYNVKIIGEIFSTYLIFEYNDELMLMDKHAAHERILYEKLKVSIDTQESQMLLKPLIFTLDNNERHIALENAELMKSAGFLIEDFGEHAVIIREVPLLLAEMDIEDIFFDMLKKISQKKRDFSSDALEDLLHSIACRSAVKAHDKSSISELSLLLKTVIKNDEIRHCPHGRPIIISISKREIEKKFGRIQ